MTRQRGETWAWRETMDFLHFFGEVQEQLNSSHRNQAVYEELAKRMNSHGYNRTPHQLRIKAKDLRRQYRHMKEKGQPSKGDSILRYYSLLDSILCNDHDAEPAMTTSSALTNKEKEHVEEGSSPPDGEFHSDQTPGCELPHHSSPKRLPNASAGRPLTTRALAGRVLRRPQASIAVGLVKTRTKKIPAVKVFTKAFWQEYSKSMENFQQLFQVQLDMQRQEREKLQREALRIKKEIKATASHMQEAILTNAAAINRVGNAIETYNTLLQSFLSGHGSQMGKNDA